MRYAALCLENGDIDAEDYLNDRVLLKDSDILPTGYVELPADFWTEHETVSAGKDGSHSLWHIQGPLCNQFAFNDCVYGKTLEGTDFLAKVIEKKPDGVILKSLTRYDHSKNAVSCILAKNREQIIAFDHLMDPNIDLISILGGAGTGKSLCTEAAGYELTTQGKVDGIVATRAMMPVEGEEIGFLKGDLNEKFGPWMAETEDNKAVILRGAERTKNTKIEQIVQDKSLFEIIPIGFLRGRTLEKRFMIIREAQNLTPYQVKLLVTRAGNDTKLVFCGNLGQIDNPFLDEKSSGLAYLVMRMRDNPHVAHVILQESVRSRLTKLGDELL
jgi:PhoH-like ATPase